MKTVYPDENNVVLDENSVERKPCINRESKSLELKIQSYSCHDINMKLLVLVTPTYIYQRLIRCSANGLSRGELQLEIWIKEIHLHLLFDCDPILRSTTILTWIQSWISDPF